MATLMRCAAGVCTVIEPTWTVRISRFVRRRAMNDRSEAVCVDNKGVQVNRAVKEAELSVCDRSGGQKHGDRAQSQTLQFTASQTQKTANKQAPSELKQVDDLWFEKAYPDDKRLSRLVNLARSKKLREQQGKILLEGRHFISNALEAGVIPQTIFFSNVERLQELPLNKLTQASLIKAKLEDTRIWPDHDTPPELIGIFRRPDVSQMRFSEAHGKPLPLTLICDNVRDPANLATTLRCAAAAGCHSVLLTKGCVDVWEPKILRVAMGAHFRLPIIPSVAWTDILTHLPPSTTVHVADNCRGIPADPEHSASQPQRKAGDYGWVSSHHDCRKIQYEEEEGFTDEDDEVGGQRKLALETQPYHTSWTGKHTAIVIGGETHGLSREALRLADETGGRRLLIPMVRGVDSLNSAMAASVLLFEGRRQLMSVT